jgi:hypothetical protein
MKFRLACGLSLAVYLCTSGFLSAQQPTSTPATAPTASTVKYDPLAPPKHKIGPIDITVNWRARAEGWDFFKGPTGHGAYTFGHSQLRVGFGQQREHLDWYLEGEQITLVGLPRLAVVPAPQGQLGLGGSYFAANSGNQNTAGGFLKQGFVQFKNYFNTNFKIGRFEYFDGNEVKPKDPMLATVISTRIAQRLIANFGFAAVQRTFDGVQVSSKVGPDNFTFVALRPTEGVFQVQGMGELDVDTYYGAFTVPVEGAHGSGQLRVFGLGYIDHRTLTLKTDNRPAPVRAADLDKLEIATYGIDYVHVFHTPSAGNFDLLGWGVIQRGAWGVQDQHSTGLVGEVGWQPPAKAWKPWISAGYSFGSGDHDPTDNRHGTFFQVLTTPRQYARFPFYNMMDNEDFYGTFNLKPTSRLSLRSEAHWMRLASARDLWYSGGGAFQANTFGYQGRPAPGNGARGLANVWDVSADYQFTRSFAATLYYGHAWGKSVVDHIFPKDPNAQLLYLETNVRF